MNKHLLLHAFVILATLGLDQLAIAQEPDPGGPGGTSYLWDVKDPKEGQAYYYLSIPLDAEISWATTDPAVATIDVKVIVQGADRTYNLQV